MTLRQRERKATRVACHNARQDNRKGWKVASVAVDGESIPWPPKSDPAVLHGPVLHKPSIAKMRRLIVRTSRKANR